MLKKLIVSQHVSLQCSFIRSKSNWFARNTFHLSLLHPTLTPWYFTFNYPFYLHEKYTKKYFSNELMRPYLNILTLEYSATITPNI